MEKGIEKGMEKGRQEGKNNSKEEIARRLLESGMEAEEVTKVTELLIDRVMEIQHEIQNSGSK